MYVCSSPTFFIMIQFKQKQYSQEDRHVFLSFLSVLNGFLCRGKNLHWAAKGKDIHEYLDDLHEIIGKFQDAIAEGYMGILEQMGPLDVQYVECNEENPKGYIDQLLSETLTFYNRIPAGAEFKGISGETESFIQDVQKYKYLFGLC